MTTSDSVFPIIQTKFHRPPIYGDHVPRPQLLDKLDQYQQRPLSLISAPAGYGKSTITSSWLNTLEKPQSWISLDEYDNDLPLFLMYFITAVRGMFPDTMENSFALVNAAELPPLRVLINSLINDLSQIQSDFVLVLDDYHTIHNYDIHDVLIGVLQYPPPTLHLVIVTRTDPPLNLSSLRAKNRLVEIRSLDLRFNETEVETYLERLLDKNIDEETVSILEEKTEGWITGIHLLGLSMKRVPQFDFKQIDHISNNYLVEDFLISNILESQDIDLQECLLKVSILDRFCAELCTAVCQQDAGSNKISDGQTFISKLGEANLFTIPLDGQRHWFRYHHLFQELLRNQLQQRKGEDFIFSLHQRASQWFAENGLIEEALHHSLAANDTETAVGLVAQHRQDLMNQDQWRRLDRWLNAFPQQIINQNPNLLIAKAWVFYYYYYDLVGTIQALDNLDDLLKNETESVEIRQIAAESLAIRSQFLYWYADQKAVSAAVAQVLEDTPKVHECVITTAVISQSGIYQLTGNMKESVQLLRKPIKTASYQTHSAIRRLYFALCANYWAEGDLINLQKTAAHFLQISQRDNTHWSRSYALYYLGLAHYERNELDDAKAYLSQLIENLYLYPMQNVCQGVFPLALIYQAQGKPEKADAVVEVIKELAQERQNEYFITMVDVLKMELELCRGQSLTAVHWATQYELGDLTASVRFYVPELTVIKALLRDETPSRLEKAIKLLETLQAHYTAIHSHKTLIRLCVLRTMAEEKRGNHDLSFEYLKQAVAIGKQSGWKRPFLDADPNIFYHLTQLKSQSNINGTDISYIDQILADLPQNSTIQAENSPPNIADKLVDPLTSRELEVLALLKEQLSNKEIAERMVISAATVRNHTHNIYQKLLVKNRGQAVTKALKMGLFPEKPQ